MADHRALFGVTMPGDVPVSENAISTAEMIAFLKQCQAAIEGRALRCTERTYTRRRLPCCRRKPVPKDFDSKVHGSRYEPAETIASSVRRDPFARSRHGHSSNPSS